MLPDVVGEDRQARNSEIPSPLSNRHHFKKHLTCPELRKSEL
jgi:hypothetical protein